MASNGVGNPGSTVLILYKVVNSESDGGDAMFNAFAMPRGAKGPTLAGVKQNCRALHGMNHLGPEGYHWRVCVEDKPVPGETATRKSFSWWDIQDPNAILPVKEASSGELGKFFAPPKEDSSADVATKAAKGAFKSLGKAMSHAVTGHDGIDYGPPVSIVAFKLLDLVKMHDDFVSKNHGRSGRIPATPKPPAAQPAPQRQPAPRPQTAPRPAARASAPATYQAPRPAPPRPQAPAPVAPQANLMDFGSTPSAGSSSHGSLHHSSSFPGSTSNPNETRAERLKREYAKKKSSSNRVWDDVDQRWVEVHPKEANGNKMPTAQSNGTSTTKAKGISLDPANAVGKSASVQAAVNARVNDMRESQAKALQTVREQVEKKKQDEAEEDAVRKRLEPRIKAWSEEHGKKKQLRALLGTLHTILWPEANWKTVSLGDILDDSKCKRCYHKASRVVHPDKTHHLDAEKRFLAKRIFDALSQAKTNFDNGLK